MTDSSLGAGDEATCSSSDHDVVDAVWYILILCVKCCIVRSEKGKKVFQESFQRNVVPSSSSIINHYLRELSLHFAAACHCCTKVDQKLLLLLWLFDHVSYVSISSPS